MKEQPSLLTTTVTVDGIGVSNTLPTSGCFRSSAFTAMKPALGLTLNGRGLALLLGAF